MRELQSPVFKSLNRPKTIKGVEYMLVVALVMFSASFGLLATLSLWFLLGIFLNFMIFMVLRNSTMKEPMLFKIYKRYMWQADSYEPWPDIKPKRNVRPLGFGQSKWLK